MEGPALPAQDRGEYRPHGGIAALVASDTGIGRRDRLSPCPMKKLPALLRSSALTLAVALSPAPIAAAPVVPGDPYIWLEDIEGLKAIAQVEQWNGETDRLLRAD